MHIVGRNGSINHIRLYGPTAYSRYDKILVKDLKMMKSYGRKMMIVLFGMIINLLNVKGGDVTDEM